MTFGVDFGLMTIVVGHATFCVVIVYNNVIARLRRLPASPEEASGDLGADMWTTFRRVTAPRLGTALLSGALLAFALSFDEIIVTNFTAGPGTQTIPMWILSAHPATERAAGGERRRLGADPREHHPGLARPADQRRRDGGRAALGRADSARGARATLGRWHRQLDLAARAAALTAERARLLVELGEPIEGPGQMTYGSQAAAASQVFEQQRDLALRERSRAELHARRGGAAGDRARHVRHLRELRQPDRAGAARGDPVGRRPASTARESRADDRSRPGTPSRAPLVSIDDVRRAAANLAGVALRTPLDRVRDGRRRTARASCSRRSRCSRSAPSRSAARTTRSRR